MSAKARKEQIKKLDRQIRCGHIVLVALVIVAAFCLFMAFTDWNKSTDYDSGLPSPTPIPNATETAEIQSV
jgi:hypothetical protein